MFKQSEMCYSYLDNLITWSLLQINVIWPNKVKNDPRVRIVVALVTFSSYENLGLFELGIYNYIQKQIFENLIN